MIQACMLILHELLDGLRAACVAFPDKRKGDDATYTMTDIGLSAFSLFFMQSESFLSYQRSLEEGRKTSNCHTLFGMAKIPTDNHIRSMLDPVHPSHLQSSFDQVVYDFMNGATLDEVSIARKEGAKKLTYRYRWFSGAPLRDGKDALAVNWIGVTISDAKGKVTYDGAFVTSLKVSRENVAEIAACARARWKIENESFNILKNNGYHLEHNFGHGKQNLAMLFAAMNMLAFAIHTACDCLEDLWVKAREAKGARKRFFEHIRTITAYLVFPDWQTLMTTLINSKPPPEIEKQIAG